MAGRLAGRVAIVTGAGSGLGRAMALLFAAEGAALVAADRSGAEADVAAEIGGPCLPFSLDVADEGQVAALIAATVERFGRLDAVCNNAGISSGLSPLHETPLDVLDTVLRVNLRGAFLVMQASIRQMLQDGGGAIVNTASIASFHATPGHAAYTASKGGVLAMTRAAAVEYGARNIRVNALCPGPVETPLISSAPEEVKQRLLGKIPMGRFGQPNEIARAALFLASDDASYINGVALLADGGRSAG